MYGKASMATKIRGNDSAPRLRQFDRYYPSTQAIASSGKDTTLRRKALSNAAVALSNAAMYYFFSHLYH
jgi:hypothetical protein